MTARSEVQCIYGVKHIADVYLMYDCVCTIFVCYAVVNLGRNYELTSKIFFDHRQHMIMMIEC